MQDVNKGNIKQFPNRLYITKYSFAKRQSRPLLKEAAILLLLLSEKHIEFFSFISVIKSEMIRLQYTGC